ncbi:hypothetical protein [Pseudoalteromonas sp. PAR1]|uniref:hypothetical protein n=1 Tax=Pseudoalteromonas sp. PAR1 TaxID=2853443 RepID=UPI00248B637C|nr:hypothetical protein [Pseudoalteromonas sp. PAR1]
MAKSFFSLVTELETLLGQLNTILSGDDDETVQVNGITKDSISKAIRDKFSAIQAMVQGRLAFETKAEMDAAGAPANAALAEVWNDPDPLNSGLYGWKDSAWIKSNFSTASKQFDKFDIVNAVTANAVWEFVKNDILKIDSKNLVDKSEIRAGYYYSPGLNKIFISDSYRVSGFIPVEEGKTYVQSGGDGIGAGGYFTSRQDEAAVGQIQGNPFTVPVGQGIKYVAINITGNWDEGFDETFQLEEGTDKTEYSPYQRRLPLAAIENSQELATFDFIEQALILFSKNLLDIDKTQWTKRFSPGSNKLQNADGTKLVASDFIPVEEGMTYSIGGEEYSANSLVDSKIGLFNSNGSITAISELSDFKMTLTEEQNYIFTVPTGYNVKYVILNLFVTGDLPYNTLKGNVQFNKGDTPFTYTAYNKMLTLKPESFPDPSFFSDDDFIFKVGSHNLINPMLVDYVNRYSSGAKAFVPDGLGIACSEAIPVEEGEWYVASGDAIYGQGGYLSGKQLINTNVVDNIIFVTPVSGIGKAFLVPLGMGITHAVLNLHKFNNAPESTSLNGNAQLERGEVPTKYEKYQKKTTIKEELLPSKATAPVSATLNPDAWYKFVEADNGSYLSEKLPVFRKHWLKRDKDLVVVNTGTSLTARSTEHCTAHDDAKFRPPLMHSNNFASLFWDKVRWDLQQYRRYDSGFFIENGRFSLSSNLPEWDDGPYRNGLTKYSQDLGASVSFYVPINAWQFNFIYRTDTTATETAKVTIAEGDGKMEVLNESGQWVEANGFIFSMREAEPQQRSVSVPKASDNTYVNRTITSKGNTTYQKRLKMRCKSALIDSRSEVKNVIVSNSGSGGRFMYWGVEWSPREYMITYINAARGSHNTQAQTELGLPRFADNEVWSFKPDLMFFELPIHNDGASGSNSYSTVDYWERLTNHFVFDPNYELSMKERSSYFGLNPEIAMFTSSIAWNFGGIDDDGSLKFSEQGDGKILTALDKFTLAHQWVIENHPEVICINAAERWVDAAIAIHGDLKKATVASGKNGNTFTNEGSHWNDTGSKIIAKAVLPIIDFK